MNNISIDEAQADKIAKELANDERKTASIWRIIAIIQIIMCIGIIMGIWNLYAAGTHKKAAKNIEARLRSVPDAYRNSSGNLMMFLMLNLFLGGFIGIIGVFNDMRIRSKILKNAEIFTK